MKKWLVMIISVCIAIGVALLIRNWAYSNVNDLEEAELLADISTDPQNLGIQLLDSVKNRDWDTTTALLEAGADVDFKHNLYHDGRPPLVVAVANESWEMIPLLLDYGADRTVTDKDTNTAYDWAVQYPNDPDLNDLLDPTQVVEAEPVKGTVYPTPAA